MRCRSLLKQLPFPSFLGPILSVTCLGLFRYFSFFPFRLGFCFGCALAWCLEFFAISESVGGTETANHSAGLELPEAGSKPTVRPCDMVQPADPKVDLHGGI